MKTKENVDRTMFSLLRTTFGNAFDNIEDKLDCEDSNPKTFRSDS